MPTERPHCEQHQELMTHVTEIRIAMQKVCTALDINGSGTSGYISEIFDRLRSIENKQAAWWALMTLGALIGSIFGAVIVGRL